MAKKIIDISNLSKKYKRFDGETDDELIYRVTGDKEQIGTWEDVAKELNRLLHKDYNESTYRKKRQEFDKMFGANRSKFADSEAQLAEIEDKIRELERAKVQFRDERNAWQQQNRVDARMEQKLDYLNEKLAEIGRVNFETHDTPQVSGDNDLIIQLSDLHIGQTFDSWFGKYDTDIAQERMAQYLNEILEIQKMHSSQNAYVVLQGDCISGSIHKNLQVTNREDVIQQIKICVELITSFCYELTNHFENVVFCSVVGNHSRIDRKEDALHSERLDDLISWEVCRSLEHIENFSSIDNEIDNGIAVFNVRGNNFVSVHGDYDHFSKSGISSLCMALGFIPKGILFGHLHHCSYDEEQGIYMIRGGSLPGCGDAYTVEKRIVGQPSQMVTVCNEAGVVCCYPVRLK